MEGSSHFSVPHQNSDEDAFKPSMKLPDHLEHYQQISADLRQKMTPVMKAVLELTDKTVLRSAAMPQGN